MLYEARFLLICKDIDIWLLFEIHFSASAYHLLIWIVDDKWAGEANLYSAFTLATLRTFTMDWINVLAGLTLCLFHNLLDSFWWIALHFLLDTMLCDSLSDAHVLLSFLLVTSSMFTNAA